MSWPRGLGIAAGALALIGGVAAYVAVNTYSDAPLAPAWQVSGDAEIPAGAVTVRFTGTTTLLFSDGTTQWMVDGWFSRPGVFDLTVGEVEPDLDAITFGLAQNRVTELAAVLPVHSHFDHAMDAPEVARRTGALLMGSESTANIGRGWNLPEAQIRVLRDRVPVALGDFVLTPIANRHYVFPSAEMNAQALANTVIAEPLVPPVPATDYLLGIPWVFHVAHPKGSFVIVGSAGYEEGDLDGLQADAIFLGIGGLGGQTETYREEYWHETVETLGARVIYPVHYDALIGPIEGPFTGPDIVLTTIGGGPDTRTLPFLQQKLQADPNLRIVVLPRYEEVIVFR